MEFVKAHGTGNDFIVLADLADRGPLPADLVRALCDRHFGVGADGVIRIARGRRAAFRMDYRNADGTTAEMCGNGVRVVGKYLGDRGLAAGDELDLETPAGVKRLLLHRDRGTVARVTVDMGTPILDRVALGVAGAGPLVDEPVPVAGRVWRVTGVSMGNPHAVTFVDDVETAPVTDIGPRIERHPMFTGGANVEFVAPAGPDRLRQRTWERGVGETLACGTGACAVAVAARLHQRTGAAVTIELRGGELDLELTDGGSVLLTGPAVEVGSGRIAPDWLATVVGAATPLPAGA